MNTNHKILAALFCVAVVIRLIAWWVVPDPILSTNATIAYLGGAQKLLEGDGFRDPAYPIFTPPLYAIVIALCSSLFGNDQTPIKAAQIIVDGFTVIIVYFIMVQVFGERVALFSSVAWALYPFAIYPTLYIGSETFFTFLLSSFTLVMLHALRSKKSHQYLLSGILLGLATQMRGTTQFLPLVLPLFLLAVEKVSKRLVVNYLVLCLGFASILFPWGMRNYLVLGHFIPVANASGVFLWGSADRFLTIDEREKELPIFYEKLKAKGLLMPPAGTSLVGKDRFQFNAALESYKEQLNEDPLNLIWFLTRKSLRTWYSTESGGGQGVILAVNVWIYPFAMIGMVMACLKQDKLALGLIGLVGYFVLLHSVSLPLFRYMIPVMPYVTSFACLAIDRLAPQMARSLHQ